MMPGTAKTIRYTQYSRHARHAVRHDPVAPQIYKGATAVHPRMNNVMTNHFGIGA